VCGISKPWVCGSFDGGLGAAGRLMTINEVDINTVPKRALVRARISRSSRPNRNRHPNFRDMRRAVILEFGRCPLLPAFAAFYWRRGPNVASHPSRCAVCRDSLRYIRYQKVGGLESSKMIDIGRVVRNADWGVRCIRPWPGGSSVWELLFCLARKPRGGRVECANALQT